MLDLCVIGAGPHALSLLTRLVDDEPDLLTEAERTRIMHKAGSRGRSHAAVRKHLQKKYDGASALSRTAVIDAHGRWMAQWEADFAALGIEHTRSHADLHPCPFDFASLRAFAEAKKRTSQLWHMQYIDREAARAAGYGGPYSLPGTELFREFCASLVERYGLAPLVRRGTVVGIRAVPGAAEGGPGADGGACTFELTLDDGSVVAARRVVCAMGPGPAFQGMRATLPWWVEDLAAELAAAPPSADPSAGCAGVAAAARLQHSSQLSVWLRAAPPSGANEDAAADASPSGGLRPRPELRGSRVLVVGGGQTSGHLSLLALRSGAASVTLAARRPITRKPCESRAQCA